MYYLALGGRLCNIFVSSSYNPYLKHEDIKRLKKNFEAYIEQLLNSVVLNVLGNLLNLTLVLLVDAQLLHQCFGVHFILKNNL